MFEYVRSHVESVIGVYYFWKFENSLQREGFIEYIELLTR
jgi:hypothetical protein